MMLDQLFATFCKEAQSFKYLSTEFETWNLKVLHKSERKIDIKKVWRKQQCDFLVQQFLENFLGNDYQAHAPDELRSLTQEKEKVFKYNLHYLKRELVSFKNQRKLARI